VCVEIWHWYSHQCQYETALRKRRHKDRKAFLDDYTDNQTRLNQDLSTKRITATLGQPDPELATLVNLTFELAVEAIRDGIPDGRCDHTLSNNLSASLIALGTRLHALAVPTDGGKPEGVKLTAGGEKPNPTDSAPPSEGKTPPSKTATGRRKLSQSTKEKTIARINAYQLVRSLKEKNPEWGPKAFILHFKNDRDFLELLGKAKTRLEERFFRAALKWITDNRGGHEMPPRNVS